MAIVRLRTTMFDLLRCKRGNALILVAVTSPLLVAAAAIGLDTIQLSLAKQTLQRSADSAATAGAFALLQNRTPTAAANAVDRDLTLNNKITLSAPRVVQNSPQSGPMTGDMGAVRVVLTAKRAVPFMSFFTGDEGADIQVEATAAAVPTGNYCVVSLETGAATGIEFGGGSAFNFGCGLATNSTGSSAIWVHGSPKVTVSTVAAPGGVPPATSFLGSPTVIPNSRPLADPFANLPHPELPVTCNDKLTIDDSGDHTVEPGCYDGMDLKKGNITLNAGTYYINGDTLSFGSKATVTGNGVTFVLTSRNAVSDPDSIASLDTSGGPEINLTAPTTGDYAGLVIYQDRRAPDQDVKINGNADSVLDGAIYMPTQTVTFNGGAGMIVRCLRLVTLRAKFTGSADVVNTCPANAPIRGFAGLTIRLVN